MAELTTKSASELAALISSGQVSAVEVAQAHLDRISAVDERVHAFLHVDAEGALAAAARVDAKRADLTSHITDMVNNPRPADGPDGHGGPGGEHGGPGGHGGRGPRGAAPGGN